MGGRGSGSGRGSGRRMTARELVNSIRNSGPNGSGTTISLTSVSGREQKIVPGPNGTFRLINPSGRAFSITRKEALGIVREAAKSKVNIKQV
nr:MAG TPA: hypothetical protein [Caudoviricetes sp.]